MAILIVIEMINTYSYKIYKNWYRNLVKDQNQIIYYLIKYNNFIYICMEINNMVF